MQYHLSAKFTVESQFGRSETEADKDKRVTFNILVACGGLLNGSQHGT